MTSKTVLIKDVIIKIINIVSVHIIIIVGTTVPSRHDLLHQLMPHTFICTPLFTSPKNTAFKTQFQNLESNRKKSNLRSTYNACNNCFFKHLLGKWCGADKEMQKFKKKKSLDNLCIPIHKKDIFIIRHTSFKQRYYIFKRDHLLLA